MNRRVVLRLLVTALMLSAFTSVAAADDEDALQEELAGIREKQREVAVTLERLGSEVADLQVALIASARAGRIDEVRDLAEKLRVTSIESGRLAERRDRLREDAREIMKALHRPDEGETEGDGEEIAALRSELEALDVAREATRRARNEKATELIEHAMRAMQLRIEGKRDTESRRIIDTAPDHTAMAEVLDYAGGLWKSWGSRNRTNAVVSLAELYRTRAAEEARDRDRGGRRGDHGRRIEALEDEVKELRAAYEKLERRMDRRR